MSVLLLDQERRDTLLKSPPWFAPAGLTRGLITHQVAIMNPGSLPGRTFCGSEVELNDDIKEWCEEFLDAIPKATYDFDVENHIIRFESERDRFHFKMRWW
jgi:hypothetical protein